MLWPGTFTLNSSLSFTGCCWRNLLSAFFVSEGNFLERMERCRKKIALSMSSDALLCRCVDLSILHLSVSINLRCNRVPLWLLHPTPSFCGAASGGTRLIPVVRSQRGRRRGHPSLFALLILLPARAQDASSKTLCRLTHVGQLVPLAGVRMLRKRDGCGKKTGWGNRG